MRRTGLAFSGGGFRASLFHLGLVRFLRDAGLLSSVTHMTSVSGGSVLAAHLALNWDRYNGSSNDFDTAAAELISFVRLDVRNRILRRFPLTMPVRWLRRLLLRRGSNRKLTRAGLLEYHYQKYLYGDTSLSELPQRPQLHILATNLSEGCICSFNRNGLLIQRRQAGNSFRFDRIHIGLATVPMAVAASSAFPGFFPPLELTGTDVGAPAGEFSRQAFTDGGVFDNLGVRLFRCLERCWLAEDPLSQNDFLDFDAVVAALQVASKSSAETPLRRLAQVLVAPSRQLDLLALTNGGASTRFLPAAAEASVGDGAERLMSGLWDLMLHYQFHREPLFAALRLMDPDAQALLHASRVAPRTLDAGDQHWLNRHLLEAAFRLATGNACFRRLNSGLDGVLVSDVGKKFEVQGHARAGGLIRTAVRATDILMDRVWQLEKETFGETPGFIFAASTGIVDPAEDPTALHPEIQRQAANIRTDLDRFSMLEISSLVRHGYCIARQACRSRPDLFGTDLPVNSCWDPIPAARGAAPAVPASPRVGATSREPARALVDSRTLQASAVRRIWSTMLDYRDWISYLYVPLLVPVLVLLPYFVVKTYQRSHRINLLVESLAQDSAALREMSRLLEDGPDKPWTGVDVEEVPSLDEPDFKGFEILQDSRVIDMRRWKPSQNGETSSRITGLRHLAVLKQLENSGTNPFRIRLTTTSPKVEVSFPPQPLEAKLRMSNDKTVTGQNNFVWEAAFDFQKVPAGEVAHLTYKYLSYGVFQGQGEDLTSLRFPIQAKTAELHMWILMPEGREYQKFQLIRYQTGKPEKTEAAKNLVADYLPEDSSFIAFKLVGLDADYTYEVRWLYKTGRR